MPETRPVAHLNDLFAGRAREKLTPAVWPDHAPDLISLSYGFAAPELFPTDALLAATSEVLAEDAPEALNYGPTYPRLVDMLVERMHAQGTLAAPDRILVSYGSSQILALLPQVLVDPGDIVIVEGPTFMGAVRSFAAAGAKMDTVPVGAHGMDLDDLESKLRAYRQRNVRPKFIYTIPTFQNPNGSLMPLESRKRLVELAQEFGVLIVEDDAYGELRFLDDPITRLSALDHNDWVVQVGTFSKILAPGIRMGWACGSPELIARLRHFKVEGDSGPYQTRVVERFCADGKLDAHIATLRAHYRERRDLMWNAIEREFPEYVRVSKPDGGFFIWVDLPEHIHVNQVIDAAAERGVGFLSGTHCFTNGQGQHSFRLAFSFAPMQKLDEAITRIGAAIRAVA